MSDEIISSAQIAASLGELVKLEEEVRRVREELEHLTARAMLTGGGLQGMAAQIAKTAINYGILAAPISLLASYLDTLRKKGDEAEKSLGETGKKANDAADAAKNVQSSMNEASAGLQNATASAERLAGAAGRLEAASAKTEALAKAVEGIKPPVDKAAEGMQNAADKTDDLANAAGNVAAASGNIDVMTAAAGNVRSEMDNASAGIKNMSNEAINLANAAGNVREASGSFGALTTAADDMRPAMDNASDGMQNAAEKTIGLANAAGNVQTAGEGLQTFADTAGNVGSLLDGMAGSIQNTSDKVGNLSSTMSNMEAANDVVMDFGNKASGASEQTQGMVAALQSAGQEAENMSGSLDGAGSKGGGLGESLLNLISPTSLAQTAIGLLSAGVDAYVKNVEAAQVKTGELLGGGFAGFQQGVESAQGYLTNFNDTLFMSAEDQVALVNNIQATQGSMVELIHSAMEEGGTYTQEQKDQLTEYFTELEALNKQQIDAGQMKSDAITQQAALVAETQQGSLEEYQASAEQWIATAQDQADKQKALAEQQYQQELALLNQQYGETANLQNTEYAQKLEAMEDTKTKAIDKANAEVGTVTAKFAEGYAERAGLSDIYQKKVAGSNQSLEDENNRHAKALEEINSKEGLDAAQKAAAVEQAENLHQEKMAGIWKKLTNNMSDAELQHLGAFTAMAGNAELYGGQMSEKATNMAQGIAGAYEDLPPKTKEAMGDAMEPMLEEMKKSEPGLFSKAMSIGKGILSRLRKAFDENSPSKETRKIFRFAMEGGALGMEDEEGGLYEQAGEIAQGVVGRLEDGLQRARLQLPELPDWQAAAQVNQTFAAAARLPEQSSDQLAAKLAKALRESPLEVHSSVDAVIEATNVVELDGERVGRSVAPTVSRVLARNIN
ncbi:hypothetical protein [Bittarella massiliensis (ex Durand et al. 2017)]|uniref:hypothetical protein n=1 Tax=Bittarella massiliensis (ex Durand et al. 2017) TaxID=1720313 RepID=UPI001AA0C454|nr:hypothetical protein [Bittarella massiliensis (ex Durand et al. 2017)]MBO1679373.1 hypothetical protein [Bittarella massiliensis (ex Durand et al. 2017)]